MKGVAFLLQEFFIDFFLFLEVLDVRDVLCVVMEGGPGGGGLIV